MSKLYGKGTIIEIERGKKYIIKFSGGKDPLSGRIYTSGGTVPENARALDGNGKPVKPLVVYGKATNEEKAEYERWQTPVKYHQIKETFLGTKRQAELRIEEIRFELENGKRRDADKIAFADWCERYLAMRENSCKYRPKTLKQDRSQSKHLIRFFGSVMIVDITPSMIDELHSAMRRNGVGDTTVKQVHKLLKCILGYAVNNDVISKTPLTVHNLPRNPSLSEALSTPGRPAA